MFAKLTTKIALQRAGLGNISLPKTTSTSNNDTSPGIPNPFANVTFTMPKALSSWQTPPPPSIPVHSLPKLGSPAPTDPKLRFPRADRSGCIVFFMRYAGCPFTQRALVTLSKLSRQNPTLNIILISHCTSSSTSSFLSTMNLPTPNMTVTIDQDRSLYALWGLGISNWGHVLNPRNGYNQILLGKNQGVWGGQVGEGGCRWQVGGAWAVDGSGVVKWGGAMGSVDEEIAFEEGVRALMGDRPGVF